MKKIKSALISVYYKDGLDDIIKKLSSKGVTLYSTGGTLSFIRGLGAEATPVEELTGFPSILGGRVKTLHPAVFGGILGRRDNESDTGQMAQYNIPEIDLVIVDLYPFAETVASGAAEQDVIEKIDIGGISLIRAAAKNFQDTVIISSVRQYPALSEIVQQQDCSTTLEQRRRFATEAFAVSSGYDSAIFNWFDRAEQTPSLRVAYDGGMALRYGENPHQKAFFYGDIESLFEKLHGKDISYNNLLDIHAAVALISEFDGDPTFAILKHNNACGVAVRPTLCQAWKAALACDPVSAYGGVVIANRPIDSETAAEVNKLFCEVILAPDYSPEALEILRSKKNRIILRLKEAAVDPVQLRTILNGVALQERDLPLGGKDTPAEPVTARKPGEQELSDLLFANKIVKHSKSNAIVLAKDNTLLASGIGQTSRVDALRQAIEKAKSFGFDLTGAAMASDAFFPFSDCVEIAYGEGIRSIIQPGGSVRDADSIGFCDGHGMSMVVTGMRHFKH